MAVRGYEIKNCAFSRSGVTLLMVIFAWIPFLSLGAKPPKIFSYISPMGFKISTTGTPWEQVSPPSNNPEILAMFRSSLEPEKSSLNSLTTLTLRIDTQSSKKTVVRNFNSYTQKWLKEYGKYNYQYLGSRWFLQNHQKGFVIDLRNEKTGNQVRQVLFQHKDSFLIFTCTGAKESFQTQVKNCNTIIKTLTF